MNFTQLYVLMWKGLNQHGKITMLGVFQHNTESNTDVKNKEISHELSA